MKKLWPAVLVLLFTFCSHQNNPRGLFLDNLLELCNTAYPGRITLSASVQIWENAPEDSLTLAFDRCKKKEITLSVRSDTTLLQDWVLTIRNDTLSLNSRQYNGSPVLWRGTATREGNQYVQFFLLDRNPGFRNPEQPRRIWIKELDTDEMLLYFRYFKDHVIRFEAVFDLSSSLSSELPLRENGRSEYRLSPATSPVPRFRPSESFHLTYG